MATRDGRTTPTIADVARRAGVSPSTVSYALTGARPISERTRERIRRAMRELGYQPNVFARGLKSKRSRIIAVLFPRDGSDLGMSSLEYVLGASDHAQELGYHLLLWTTGMEALQDLAELTGQGLIDGALLMEVRLEDPRIDVLRRAEVDFVMIGRTADPAALHFADTNFDQCARLAIDHLAGEGHRRLGLVDQLASTVRAGRGNVVRLREGVLAAARDAGVRVTPLACEGSTEAGRAAFAELVAQDPGLTAVVAFNEQAAPGVMGAAIEHGWRIPRDFSILSVDMSARPAQMTSPPMSTVGPDAARMGRAAAGMLIRRLEGLPVEDTQMLFDGRLELRGSCGPVRRTR
jgi:DNA-binding LacI/PurR family transcriptional regulator